MKEFKHEPIYYLAIIIEKNGISPLREAID